MSAASRAWIEEPVESDTADHAREPERSSATCRVPPHGARTPAARVTEDARSSSGPSWNVLAEQLVAFPRPAYRPFLGEPEPAELGEAREPDRRSYGERWLEQETARLRQRAGSPSAAPVATTADRSLVGLAREASPPSMRARTACGPRAEVSYGPAALAEAWSLDQHHEAVELRFALDRVLSPERRARVAPAAALPRTRAASSRSRGLRRLLPGAATLAVLAFALAGAGALASGPRPQTGVLPGSVRVPSGGYVYTVRTGDTLWSIASRLQPGGDPRPIVAQLQGELGGQVLVAGERIHVP